ncbi:MAG: bifunctional riboflavin kinase/FAD synthetase [candidate division WOR-3 bacterium]
MQSNLLEYSVIEDLNKLPQVSGFLAMGNFDGVHLGHQVLIKKGKEEGDISVLTYDPHPFIRINEIKEPFLLTTIREKIFFLKKYLVKEVIILRFSPEISQMCPEDFLKSIIKERMNPKGIIIGFDHHFGKGKKGDSEFLKKIGEDLGLRVFVVPPVRIGNKVVKSSKIREFLRKGKMKSACEMLGHPYLIEGKVTKGDEVGRTLGYPTANLEIDSEYKLLPLEGVYSSIVELGEENFPAMVYIGSSPTLGINRLKVEAHIFGFSKDIYGERIRCFLYSLIRKKEFFSSEGSLRESIKKTEEETLKNLKEVYKWELPLGKNKN